MNLIRMCHSNAIRQLPWDPEVFSLTNEREAKRRNAREPLGAHVGETRENLWAHTLGPLNEREVKRRNVREPLSAHVRSFERA